MTDALGFAVLTISDTRDETTDRTGPWLREQISAAGHAVKAHAIIADDAANIRKACKDLIADPDIHCIITTGGTGLTGRDVTPEAIRPLLDKEIDGFSVVFHMISYQSVGVSTLQSRALAGIAGGTYLFAIPGSMGAVKDAWNGVLKAEFDPAHKPCNLVEILPRLTEHLA
ncbi:molybdenum cofactor synthesis domain-containing protein [Maricaulis parjimensis]|uniref:molybdenum cofactor synthesis domain-containing protein n=1 Tax=Maricaulis parjimensis TaxID=144023 RepID=UPI0019399CD8|nr:molybdenum cofactor synthesis domain-containing protein [Maricaulis parjimensis]